jgi:hypothetical protein
MAMIKRYLFLIICILVVLGGCFAHWYGSKMREVNSKELSKVQSVYNKIGASKKRLVNNNIKEINIQHKALVTKDTLALKSKALATSSRNVLYKDVFPKPKGEHVTPKYNGFGKAYRAAVDNLLNDMSAGQTLTKAEIDNIIANYQSSSVATLDSSRSKRSAFDGFGGVGGRSRNRGGVGGEQEAQLIEEKCRQRAEQFAVYATPESFCGYKYWEEIGSSADSKGLIVDSWGTQLAYWISQDVVSTIKKVNALVDGTTVQHAAVKRLIEISFGGLPFTAPEGSVIKKNDAPGVVASAEDPRMSDAENFLPGKVIIEEGEIEPLDSMVESWTARMGDNLTDVYHFEVAVIIDNTRINDFCNMLQGEHSDNDGKHQRSQMTILQFTVANLQAEEEKAAGYYYGVSSNSVLRIIGEYVFFKEGYEKQIPIVMK